MSRKNGITDEEIAAVADFATSGFFNAREKAALVYVDRMCDTPVNVTDEVFAELKKYFKGDQIVEITSAIALENYRARFDHALGIESENFYAGPHEGEDRS
ncbi:MAG: carboxymuconolactone decarboxylase family protein [Bryobacterales bacterium]|nr:carboxymuconolactone decarboxylase family protein [Bryobacterales bacterium]